MQMRMRSRPERSSAETHPQDGAVGSWDRTCLRREVASAGGGGGRAGQGHGQATHTETEPDAEVTVRQGHFYTPSWSKGRHGPGQASVSCSVCCVTPGY